MTRALAEFSETVTTARQTVRTQGLRAGVKTLWKQFGWKLVALVIAYYIVRDVTLYVILPALLIKGMS